MNIETEFNIGDIIEVEYQNLGKNSGLRRFKGICIKRSGKNELRRVVLRNVIDGVGIELGICLDAPNVLKVRKVKSSTKKIRRSKLYYLREKPLSKSMA